MRDEVEIQLVFAKRLVNSDWKIFSMSNQIRRRLWPLSESGDSVAVPLKDRSGNKWHLEWKRRSSGKGWWLGGQTREIPTVSTVSGFRSCARAWIEAHLRAAGAMLTSLGFCAGDLYTLTFDAADKHWLVERNNLALEVHVAEPALGVSPSPKKRRRADDSEEDDEMPVQHCYDGFNGKARAALRKKVLASINTDSGVCECRAARDKAHAALLKRDAFVQ